jgi:signal transduction histidine kinase
MLLAARIAWISMAILAGVLFFASIPINYAQFHTICQGADCYFWQLSPREVAVLQGLGLSLDFYAGYGIALRVLYAAGFCALGVALFLTRPTNWIALYASMAFVLTGVSGSEPLAEAYPSWSVPVALVGFLGEVLFFTLFYIFPDGRFVPRWTRVPAIILIANLALHYFLPDWKPSSYGWVDLLIWLILGLATILSAQIYRYIRVSGPVERQQTKWVVFGLTAASLIIAVMLTSREIFSSSVQSSAVGVLYPLLGFTVYVVAILLIPISIAFAILKYRLWDIDIIINRTLVYSGLSASVVGLYALLVVGLGSFLQADGNFVTSLVAAGMVAVLFAPLRVRLQRSVNRLMYGERDEPYIVLSRLGKRLEGTLAPELALETVAQAVAYALKLPYAAIELRREDGYKRVAEYGEPKEENSVLPLVHQGETVGRLVVAPRSRGEEFSHQDKRLLEDLAWQAGAAAHAALLTSDLRRSRERLVSAREEERRRLRRDLHDGLGPTLGGLTLGLDAARSTLGGDLGTTDALLADLKVQTQEAVSDVRRLVHGLRPPALDDLGLLSAIRQIASNHGHLLGESAVDTRGSGSMNELNFSVEAPAELPSLPAAVEVACYRIAQEATTNVSRHSRARHCTIRLRVDEITNELMLEVEDDGVGMPEGRRAGVGMSSMRERAEELGGTLALESPATDVGTRVLARLPLPQKEKR